MQTTRARWIGGMASPAAGPEPNSTEVQCTHASQPTHHEGTITVDVSDTAGNRIRCTYSGAGSAGTPTNGPDCVGLPPPAPSLAIAKVVSPRYSAHVGDTLTWTIDVTNSGDAPAEEVTLDDPLPDNAFDPPSFSTTAGTCEHTSDNVHCDLGDIEAGGTVTVTVIATAKAKAVRQTKDGEFRLFENTATARSGDLEASSTEGALILPKCGSEYKGVGADGKAVTLKVRCGDDGADKIKGGSKPELIDGGGGNDELFGVGGSDFLFGGDGKDLLDCGKGKDIGVGGPAKDRFKDCEEKTQ